MPIKVLPPPLTDQVKIRAQGIQILAPLKPLVDRLTIQTASDYLDGDELVGRVRSARAKWASLVAPVKVPLDNAAREIRDAQKGVKALNESVDGPLEQLELSVKARMRAFKLEEQRQIQAAEQERQQESDRLRREAAQKAQQEAAAKTPQMKAKLAQKRAELEARAEAVETDPDADMNPDKGGSSVSRTITRPQIVDLGAFLAALKDYQPQADLYQFGHPPLSLVTPEMLQAGINRIYKDQPLVVKSWPGVEIVSDIIIAGR